MPVIVRRHVKLRAHLNRLRAHLRAYILKITVRPQIQSGSGNSLTLRGRIKTSSWSALFHLIVLQA